MTYKETVDYLYSRLPLFSRIGSSAYKADITNTVLLCDHIGNPHSRFKSVHIAGTNGKGSTSHMLAAILQQAGLKTGLYTSPHLKDFRERIKIDGKMIEEDFIVDFVENIRLFSEQLEPSFFELTVAMAFSYFAQEKVDIAVIETGLGGRLDSTNIISPLLSVITNIGYDHQNILGNSLEEIAMEKAGIIKKNTPVVIGEATEITKPVFLDKAITEQASIRFASEEFEVIKSELLPFSLHVQVKEIDSGQLTAFDLDLNGIYQQKNLLTVITALSELNKMGFQIDLSTIRVALSAVKKLTGLLGRWDVLQEQPYVILDVAHNEDGIRQLIRQLGMMEYKNLHIITGMVKDKDPSKVLSILPVAAKYYFTNAHIPRALPAAELKMLADSYNLAGEDFDDVNKALESAKNCAEKEDMILICGSVFLVGEVDY